MVVPLLIYVPVQLAAPFDRRLADSAGDLSPPIGLVYRVLPAWSRSRLVKRLTQHRRYTVHGLRKLVHRGRAVFVYDDVCVDAGGADRRA